MSLVRRAFTAMGTTCELVVAASPEDEPQAQRALAAGLVEVETCERVLTRFQPTSDLSRLNGALGEWLEVDPRLVAALRAAVDARRVTRGRFDPTILEPLVAAGYDRTFAELTNRPPRPADGWRRGAAIWIDEDRCRARLERGSAVDLGGIGKGFSAARALEAMRLAWPEMTGGFADLGGDFAFRGRPTDGDAWRVAVADPRNPGASLATLQLNDGGIATSGRDRRRFGPGRSLHHLIDPETGAAAARGPLAVTVVARDASEAEALGTAFAISELEDVRRLARERGVAALYVPETGSPVEVGTLPLAPRYRIELAA
jgi:thiamine biosynthesis lipoprotein